MVLGFFRRSESFARIISPVLYVGFFFFNLVFMLLNYMSREYIVFYLLMVDLILGSIIFIYYQVWFRFMRKIITIHVLDMGGQPTIIKSDVINSDKTEYEYNKGVYQLRSGEAVLSSRKQPIYYLDRDDCTKALSFKSNPSKKNPQLLKTFIEDKSTKTIMEGGITMDKMATIIIIILIIVVVVLVVFFTLLLKGVIK